MTITWEIISAFLVVGGVVAGSFWRIWGLIGDAKREAMLRADAAIALASVAREELAAHKLHTAETFVTKAGMQEQTTQIMKAIESVGGKLDHLNGRIDGLMQPKAAATRARTG